VLDGKDPADYIQYTANPHILSMVFEGPLCGCLNFYNEYGAEFDNRIINGFSSILDRYGLYYELGDHWNLSCYSNHASRVEREQTQQLEDTIIIFRGECVNPAYSIIPEPLLRIQEIWKEKSDAHGDAGACVLGAGFHFTYQDRSYFMPPISRWQGSGSWEHFVEEITQLLKEAGATNIRFEYGNMD